MQDNALKFRKVIDNARDLPTLSVVAARLNDMVKSPTTSANDVGDLISQDVALTTKTLKLVNSSFYGFPKKINSITHAIVILGFNKVKNIALAASVLETMNRKTEIAFDYQGFWEHSIGTAICTEALARALKSEYVEDAFVAGLLHDLGKLIVVQYFPEEYLKVRALIDNTNIPMFEAENEVFGFNHSQPGQWLTEKWNFPDSLTSAIRMHHNPLMARQHRDLIWLVHVGDIFARALCVGNGGDPFIPELDETLWERMKLTPALVDGLFKEILEGVAKADEFLDLVKEKQAR